MSRPVRFIHAADLHLGSPLRALGSEAEAPGQRLDRATYRALERLVSAALAHQVDFVVLAGDIYDRKSRSVWAADFLQEQLLRLSEEGIPVFIIYGNHDPLTEELVSLPEGVTVFGADEVEEEMVYADEVPVARVMGQSYRNTSESRKMYAGFTAPDEDVLNVGVLHTALDPQARRYVPCSLDDLTGKEGIHYWALGHVHSLGIRHTEMPYVAYPGVPQGRHVREPGVGGCLLVEARPGAVQRVRFVPTSDVIWVTERVQLEDLSPSPGNVSELREVLRDRASDILNAGTGELTSALPVQTAGDVPTPSFVVRWVITGRGELHTVLGEEGVDESREVLTRSLREDFGHGETFLWTESVQLETAAPLPDLQILAESDPVVAELVKLVDFAEEDEHFRAELIKAAGEVWDPRSDPEEENPESFALTEDRLEQLIGAAFDLILDRIVEERADHVV